MRVAILLVGLILGGCNSGPPNGNPMIGEWEANGFHAKFDQTSYAMPGGRSDGVSYVVEKQQVNGKALTIVRVHEADGSDRGMIGATFDPRDWDEMAFGGMIWHRVK